MHYLNCFFTYSILGYLLETITAKILNNNFNSGILIGIWTPIYGIGSIIILLISNFIFKKINNKYLRVLLIFILVTIILTILEGLGGLLIEKTFNITYWNYSKHRFNIGKYMSLTVSLVWGIGSLIFVYFIHPRLNKYIKVIPKWGTFVLTIVFIIDIFLTTYIKLIK